MAYLLEADVLISAKNLIPNACMGVGVKCATTFQMLRRERARFVLGAAP